MPRSGRRAGVAGASAYALKHRRRSKAHLARRREDDPVVVALEEVAAERRERSCARSRAGRRQGCPLPRCARAVWAGRRPRTGRPPPGARDSARERARPKRRACSPPLPASVPAASRRPSRMGAEERARCTMRPRSITTASSVSESAMSVCCSTSIIAMPLSEVLEEACQLLHDDRRQALERLVEQQQRRVGHQRARDGEHLLLAAGELVAHVGFAPPGGEQLVDPLQVPAAGARGDGEVLLHAERGEDLALLRHPADAELRAPVRGRPLMSCPLKQDRAVVQPGIAHDGEQQRGLADAVAAEHREAAVAAPRARRRPSTTASP